MYGERQHAKAIADLTTIIEAVPMAAAYAERGTAKDFSGLHAEALADFTEAVRLGAGEYRRSRGMALMNLDRREEAIGAFDAAVGNDPDDAENYYYRGAPASILAISPRPRRTSPRRSRCVPAASSSPYGSTWRGRAPARMAVPTLPATARRSTWTTGPARSSCCISG